MKAKNYRQTIKQNQLKALRIPIVRKAIGWLSISVSDPWGLLIYGGIGNMGRKGRYPDYPAPS